MNKKWLLPAVGALLGLLGLGVAWQWWHREESQSAAQEDLRLTFATPYRNVRPDVKYVGDQACVRCHQEESRAYRQHPMGKSLAPVAAAAPVERYQPAAFDAFVAADPFTGPGLHYRVERRGDRLIHREWAADAQGKVLAGVEAEVQFAVGSGRNGRSYLVDHDGYLFQSPITWYPKEGKWDLSPDYNHHNLHFGRPITPGCLFCHANQAAHVTATTNRYRHPVFPGYGIGCERCHGPGELHVRRRTAGEEVADLDDTIVNPARLEPWLREAVCQQCHLQAEQRVVQRGKSDFDYRPGLPLQLFFTDFVVERKRPQDFKFVGQVEQLATSRCFLASQGATKLGCISCHDPHRVPAPEEKAAYYRGRCLQCHTETSCSLSPAARRQKVDNDSCVACHMPPTGSQVSHTSIADHRIPRRAEARNKVVPGPRAFPAPSALIPFHRDLPDFQEEETSRDFGVALMELVGQAPSRGFERPFAEHALPHLEKALQRDGHDWQAWEAKGDALLCLGKEEQALAAYNSALSEQPESETTLHAAGRLALTMNRLRESRSYLERAVRVNPWGWQYHHLLAAVSFQNGEWDRAARECRESLRLEPFSSTTRRKLLVTCYLRLGQAESARAEFDTLMHLSPESRRSDLRRWFENQRSP